MGKKKGKVTSKSRLGKDEYAFCHEKGHCKKDCPKLKKKEKGKSIFDACVIERGGDSSDSEFYLVGHQTIASFDKWILDMSCTYQCVHIRSSSSILKKLMVELFIWVVVMLAISLG